MTTRLTATIRRWQNGFGFANYYDKSIEGAPMTRYFVHRNNAASQAVKDALADGVRITFEHGQPRSEGEAPVALKIELWAVA